MEERLSAIGFNDRAEGKVLRSACVCIATDLHKLTPSEVEAIMEQGLKPLPFPKILRAIQEKRRGGRRGPEGSWVVWKMWRMVGGWGGSPASSAGV